MSASRDRRRKKDRRRRAMQAAGATDALAAVFDAHTSAKGVVRLTDQLIADCAAAVGCTPGEARDALLRMHASWGVAREPGYQAAFRPVPGGVAAVFTTPPKETR